MSKRATYDPVKKKAYNDAYSARKKAERLAASGQTMTAKDRKKEVQRAWRAKKRAEKAAASDPHYSHPKPPSNDPEAKREAQRIRAREWYQKNRAKKSNGHAKANGKNGHAVEVWKPGKGSISVPSVLQAHGHGPKSASHAALVERALGLIEAGLVLVSEELRRK